MEKYKSNFLTISYLSESNVLLFDWSENTENLTDELFKKELEKELEFCEHYRVPKLLFETTKFNFGIVPELQSWISETIFPKYFDYGVKYMATILSENIFSEVSIQQTLEEDSAQLMETKYFKSKSKALEWLDSIEVA